jgi:hypothetical protein
VGFHLKYHADNFTQTVEQELECRVDRKRCRLKEIRGVRESGPIPDPLISNLFSLQAEEEKTQKTATQTISELQIEEYKNRTRRRQAGLYQGNSGTLDAIDRCLKNIRNIRGISLCFRSAFPPHKH